MDAEVLELGGILDEPEVHSELLELKARVDGLQEQVRTLEERLGA